MLDLTEPMIIEGMPDTTITNVQIKATDVIEAMVNRGGMQTGIRFRPNGWITSTTYPTSRVINRSTHEATVQIDKEAMEANTLWGAF